ncbi:hypothetical protein [Spirosoma lituiforme]
MKNLPEGSASTAAALSNRERRIITIRDEFDRQKLAGKQSKFIISDLAYRFYMTEATIEAIVWKRGRYRIVVNQPSIALAA